MQWFRADLHVHSLLSPCGAIEMTPRNIIRNAAAAGIDIVAITDHNAGDNVEAALRAAVGTGVTVLPGMEVQTREEAHILALFEKMRDFIRWCDFIRNHRSPLKNDEKRFGAQFVVDEQDEWVRTEESLLLASTDLSVSQMTSQVSEFNGLAIAAHVDRPMFSLISQLGFIPDDIVLQAVEISRNMDWQKARSQLPTLGRLPVIVSSDAHSMEDFMGGPKTMFYMETPTLPEIRLALAQEKGRRFHC